MPVEPRNGWAPRRQGGVAGVGQARLECGFKFVGAKLGQRGLAVKERRKPSTSAASAASDKSGHSAPWRRRRKATRSRHCRSAGSTAAGRRRAARHLGQDARGGRVRRCRHRLLGQHERAEPALAARAQARGRLIEGDLLARSMRSANRASISASVIGAASRMRPVAALPASSATARNGARANGDAGSTCAPRPLAKGTRRLRRRGFSQSVRGRRGREERRRTPPRLPSALPLPLVGRG